MARTPSSAAGGVFLMLGAIGGATIGFIVRQPTLWFLGGLTAGGLAALAVWWRTR